MTEPAEETPREELARVAWETVQEFTERAEALDAAGVPEVAELARKVASMHFALGATTSRIAIDHEQRARQHDALNILYDVIFNDADPEPLAILLRAHMTPGNRTALAQSLTAP
jgi:hypothetical protein